MSVNENPLFSRISESLKPFIKSRQEALRIRRILSVYVASAIGGLDGSTITPLLLAVPGRDVYVRAIPPEMSGIRRDYLLALQANMKAREAYEHTSQQLIVATENNARVDLDESKGRDSQPISTYLDLAQLQKPFQKLNVIQNYLDELRKNKISTEDLHSENQIRHEANANDTIPITTEGHMQAGDDVQTLALITRLEKAILRANHSLKCERALLEELKTKRRCQEDAADAFHPPQATRIRALQKTRDELITWIEQQLTNVNEVEADPEAWAFPRSEDSGTEIEQQKCKIEETYQNYLEVRRSIMDLLSRRPSIANIEVPMSQKQSISSDSERGAQQPSRDATTALPLITEYMIPLADAQRALLQQEAHISCSVNVQKRAINRVVDRLADESHLLANYPTSAMEPPVLHPPVVSGGSMLSPSPLEDTSVLVGDAHLSRQAQAWAFASDAARAASNTALGEQLDRGERHAATAKSTLTEMQDLLGVDNDDGSDDSDADIWNPEKSVVTKGIWAGLDGGLGADTSH